MQAEEAATEEKRQSGPLLGLSAQRWIFELGTLVRTYVQNDTANGEGGQRANECASHQHRSGAADHVGHRPTSFVNSLMYLETRQIQRGSGACRGARGASAMSAANVVHDLRIDLAS